MTRLKAVKPKTVEPSKAKILIFGEAGVGKTFTSLDFPNCYYIDSEGGATRQHYTDKLEKSNAAYFGTEQGSQDFNEVIEQVKALAIEKHSYKTLIIDSISKLYNGEITKEAERLGDKDAFGASKKPAIAKTRQLINWLERIDMNVILIAHEAKEWANEKQIGVKADAYEKLMYELDLILNIRKTGDSRNAFVKKSRLQGFPDGSSLPWTYEEFAKRYSKDVIEGEVKALELATKEQLDEMKQLLESWKAPDEWETKAFAKAKCESWAEMDKEKIEVFINFIKTKLKGDK